MREEDVLGKFKECGALLEGHFILRSGLRSRQYFQCALLLQDPVLSDEVCGLLAQKVKGWECETVVSPAMGGILVGQDVARHLKKRHVFAEKVEGVLSLKRFELKEGEKVLVAEDVVTTGSAVKETMELVRKAGGVVIGVVSIVDRSGDTDPNFGVPFESLVKLKVENFEADNLPEDLKKIPAVKPGSATRKA